MLSPAKADAKPVKAKEDEIEETLEEDCFVYAFLSQTLRTCRSILCRYEIDLYPLILLLCRILHLGYDTFPLHPLRRAKFLYRYYLFVRYCGRVLRSLTINTVN